MQLKTPRVLCGTTVPSSDHGRAGISSPEVTPANQRKAWVDDVDDARTVLTPGGPGGGQKSGDQSTRRPAGLPRAEFFSAAKRFDCQNTIKEIKSRIISASHSCRAVRNARFIFRRIRRPGGQSNL